MTDIIEDPQLAYADKIAKLLRKAEATDSQQEADLLTEKAQQLMVKYAVSEQLLAAATGSQLNDEVVEERTTYTGIFSRALFQIGSSVAQANGCKVLISKDSKSTTLYMVGFKSDINRSRLIDSSVQLQAITAMRRWWTEQDTSWMANMDKYKARREFLFGFAAGVGQKLNRAKREGVKDAVADEVARSGATEATVQTSTELVLRTRQERVKDWYDERYGNHTRPSRGNYSHGGYGARSAGHSAGMNANVNTTGIGRSTRGAIGD